MGNKKEFVMDLLVVQGNNNLATHIAKGKLSRFTWNREIQTIEVELVDAEMIEFLPEIGGEVRKELVPGKGGN